MQFGAFCCELCKKYNLICLIYILRDQTDDFGLTSVLFHVKRNLPFLPYIGSMAACALVV